jgi:uncharacterized protein (DUF952 family)
VILYHLTTRSAWDAVTTAYAPASLATEGFIHLSTWRQWPRVLDRFYRDVPDQVLLAIDADKLAAPLSHEAADGDVFPHLYGPLEVAAVAGVMPLPGPIAMPGELAAVLPGATLYAVKARDGWALVACVRGELPDAIAAARPFVDATFLRVDGPIDADALVALIDA